MVSSENLPQLPGGLTMEKSVIVYGPQACGKTRNMRKLAAAYGLPEIVDDWWSLDDFKPEGVLYTTNHDIGELRQWHEHAVPFAVAMRMVK